MTENTRQALQNAAASSAMEGLALTDAQMETVTAILEGRLSLTDYLQALKERYCPSRGHDLKLAI